MHSGFRTIAKSYHTRKKLSNNAYFFAHTVDSSVHTTYNSMHRNKERNYQMTNQAILAYDKFSTNIKNLPEGEYVTLAMYSDTSPYMVVGRTEKTIKVVPVSVKRDPEWKPEIIAGGFAGHCTNQDEQTWLFDRVRDDIEPVTLRLCKSKYCGSDKLWSSPRLGRFIANGARKKHDYNF